MWEYVAERLTPRTSDLEVRDTSLARRAVSLDKELYSTLSLFFPRCINGYRRHTPCDGLACRPGRAGGGGGGGGEGVAILLAMLHAKESGIGSGHLDLVHTFTFLPGLTFQAFPFAV